MKTVALLFSLALSISAFAQTAAVNTQTLPSAATLALPLEVQRLAPQLIAFAGSDANFQNLVNGLASGTQVTLTTAGATGTQTVTFTPTGAMTAQQIAQTLENVRQSLISRGIATPSAQQLATAITGGPLLTPAGPVVQVNGVVGTTAATNTVVQQQSPATQIQNTFSNAAAGASTSIRSQTSDSPFPRGISDSPSTTLAPQTPAPIATPPSTASVRTTK